MLWSFHVFIATEQNNLHFVRYHLPRSWLKPKENLLVLFEEWGGDPTGISLVKRVVELEGQRHMN